MPSPNINQGTLNRILASIDFASFPGLNITSPYLGKRGLTVTFQGESTVYLDTMTGAVTSPEPYLRVTITGHLIRAQSFAQLWKTQLELLTLLGNATLRPDVLTMQPYNLSNVAIMNPGDQDFSGASEAYPIRIGGIYQINSSLYT